jgi:hypothetical protein
MDNQSYPAARQVAPKVQAHFAHHFDAARRRGEEPTASLPDQDVIEGIINAAFWASLRREEGYVPKISLAFLPPEQATHPLVFERPLPLNAASLAKVAPVVERAGIHLGVWRHRGDLSVWGTTRAIPTYSLVLEVAEPGLLVVKHHSGDRFGKFINVAVLEGDQVKVIDESASSLPDCPELLASLVGFDSPSSWARSVNVMVRLAVSMRAHGRGGLLLVVPANTEDWRDSIVHPIPYPIAPAFAELAELARGRSDDDEAHVYQEALRQSVEAIAGLTAVDGATVLTDMYELRAFGAKIARRRGSTPVEQITVTEPIEGGTASVMTPAQLGGTRHLAAAQFIHDQRAGVALVASQDRRFTVFAWSPCENSVHAHRVEALLV